MYVIGRPVTLYVTSLDLPSLDVVTTAVVLAPSTKLTVSYGFTKSRASPLFFKFQPAFNTSPTVAALLAIFGNSSVVGPSESVVGAAVPGFAPGKLPATFVILTGSLLSPLPTFKPSAVGAKLTLLPAPSFKSIVLNSGLSTVLKVNLFGVL